ncbi:UNVERIFIED_CONTAM: Transposon Ty3-G Gag-Pol polyprotein [Sesamum latifolium]|uniref:Transposon Ty3-G Gag-Pol polyprotein n=1 Tax=Sesamum latifolium TaxID=2727402 RepID=A0AAW2TCS0_9LAMI
MQARQYPFLDSDVPGIFDDLLEANLIDLPEMKRPEEAERKDDLKYCKYHRLVGHAIQDCFVFKDKVMQLTRQGKISLQEDSTAANVIMIKSGYLNSNKNSCNVVHRDDIEDGLLEKEDSSDTDDCMSTITFTDEDLLLGSKPHNRPLFVAGYVREQKVNRILIDGGSVVNILPLRILKELRIPIDELSNSRLIFQDFNQGGQRADGVIRLQLTMEDMVSTAIFHVKKVLGDSKPFTEAESHFADAKYYIEGAKKEKKVLPSEEPKSYSNQSTRKNDSSTIKVELSKDMILPLTQISLKQPSKPPLKGFVPSTQEEEGGHEALAIDEKGFDPKAFKLLVKAGYNPKEKPSLGKLPPEATGKMLDGLNTTQIMLKEKEHAVQDFELGPHRKALRGIANKQSVFDRLGPHKRMGYQKKSAFKVTAYSKKNTKSSPTQKLRSLIPSRMRRQTTLAISCGKVLKVKAQTMVFTQVQSNDEDDRESVASSNYINSSTEEDFAQIYHVTLIENDEIEEEDAEDAPVELEESVKATIDELREVNLGNTENPRPIYTSASLTQEEEEAYIMLLHEFKDVFAWSYKKMSGLDPKVAVHHLSVKKGARPVKQGQRRFRPELIPLIETKVNKLIEVGSIREVKYPTWISSIVLVRKKNGQIRVCVDFRDLNNACPKDDFSLPITELMIDATMGHEALSFMDGSSGYNQIRMAPAYEELTVFRTPNTSAI